MRRVAGKIMAAILAAAVALSSPAAGFTVLADELQETEQEIVLSDSADEEIQAGEEEELAQETEGDTQQEELAQNDNLTDEGNLQVSDEDTNAGSSEDSAVDNVNGAIVIPETAGRVLRLASTGTGIQKNQHIYFGKIRSGSYNYWDTEGENKPYWRVLDPSKDNNGVAGNIFLMSETLWGNDPDTYKDGGIFFNNPNEKGNEWKDSDARTWCNSYLGNIFTEPERAAIKGISKKDDAVQGEWKTCYLENDKVFFMSVAEVNQYIGTTYEDVKASYLNDPIAYWWLRTPSWGSSWDPNYTVATVYGAVGLSYVKSRKCARPVFNVNQSSILFTSAATGGKVSGTVGPNALKAVADKATKDWKLTIKDTNRAFSAARVGSGNVQPGQSINIQYSGAKTGSNEYVSAVLCDASGNVLYYGRLASNSASGTTSVTLPQGLDAGNTYKLHVFSEQCNGDYNTDIASGLSTIDLKIPMNIKDTLLSKTEIKYNGNARIPSVTTLAGKKLIEGTDYTKVIKNSSDKTVKSPVKVGTYKMVLTGKGNYYGSATKTYKIIKGNNTLNVKKKTSSHTIKVSKLEKRKQTIKAKKIFNFVDKGQGKITYTLKSAKKGSKSYKSKFSVNSKSGKLTVKKGLKKGTYKLTVSVKADGDKNHNSKTKKVEFKIKVKK